MSDTFAGCAPLEGFHEPESDLLGPFVWTLGRFALRLEAPARFLLFEARYVGSDGRLVARTRSREAEAPIRRGWQWVAIEVGVASAGDTIELSIEPVVPADGDARELGIEIRRVEATDDAARVERIRAREANAAANEREFRAGATRLESAPPNLRVTIERRCNIAPRCVYCEWDWAKDLERGSTFDVAAAGIGALGRFGELARQVVDCSYGEPFLNRRLEGFVEDLSRRDTRLELTCNGQVLDEARRRAVLGRDVVLYVSLEAASAAAYARLRNDRFDLLVENASALCREKREREHGGRPRVVVSFIAMRSSVGEFREFLELAARIGVDGVKLRALFAEGFELPAETARADGKFRYSDEALTPDELRAFEAEARRLAEGSGITLHVDSDEFGKEERLDASAPLCSEPWATFYVMNRGLMPCCFAKKPLATLDGVESRDVPAAIEAAWNGETMREMRSALARRVLPAYCRESISCPIVKRLEVRGDAAG